MSWDVGELIGNIIGVVLDIDAPPTGAAWAVFVFLSTFFNHFNGVRWSHWRKLPMVNLYGLHFNMNVCLHFATAVAVLGMGIESVIYGSRIRPTIANMAFLMVNGFEPLLLAGCRRPKPVVHPPHQRLRLLKVLQLILPRILEFRSRMLHVYLHMSRNTMPH